MNRVVAALVLVWVGGSSSGLGGAAATTLSAATPPSTHQDSLSARATEFLEAVRHDRLNELASFFPRGGAFSYHHTAHGRTGDQKGVWRFEGADADRLVRRRPLLGVFSISFEAQPVGLFAHQVLHRGTSWRRVTATRFVPPGASPSSAVFVEWRRENGTWVIAAFGDESFPNGETPRWCC